MLSTPVVFWSILSAIVVVSVLSWLYLRRAREGFAAKQVTVTYYFLPTCPHCVAFKPQWEAYKKIAGSHVKIVEVDGSKPGSDAAAHGVKAYPTVMVGERQYDGERTASALKAFVDAA